MNATTTKRDPAAPATPTEMMQLGLSVASSVALTLGPGGAAVAAILTGAGAVLTAAHADGRDVTDEEIEALLDGYTGAQVDDDAAQAVAVAKKAGKGK